MWFFVFFFSSRRRHTRFKCDWSSDVCSSDLFENTFAILVRGDEARRLRLTTIEDAAPHTAAWQAGFGHEFLQRADGYPGLSQKYGLRFAAAPKALDLSLTYLARAQRQRGHIAGAAPIRLN